MAIFFQKYWKRNRDFGELVLKLDTARKNHRDYHCFAVVGKPEILCKLGTQTSQQNQLGSKKSKQVMAKIFSTFHYFCSSWSFDMAGLSYSLVGLFKF